MASREIRRSKTAPATETPKPKSQLSRPFYILSIVILVLIVVTFIGSPVISKLGNVPNRITFGSYGDYSIDYFSGNYFYNQILDLNQNYQRTQNSLSDAWQIWKGAFDRTVFHAGLLDLAKKSNIDVSSDSVDTALSVIGPYLDDKGEFSAAKYNATSASDRFITRNYFKENLIQDLLLNDFMKGELISKAEKQFVTGMASPERAFKFVIFSKDMFPDQQVKSFAENNANLFKTMELSRIVVKNQSDANKLRDQVINKTATFEDLAKAHSTDSFAEKSGDMGSQYYYQLRGDFDNLSDLDSLFTLSSETVSDVYKSKYGYMFYYVRSAASGIDLAKAENIATVRSYISTYERGTIDDFMSETARVFADKARSASFNAQAASDGLTLMTTEYFPINYGAIPFLKKPSSDGLSTISSTLSYRDTFFSKAFTLKAGEISEPVLIDEGVIVFEMTGEQEATSDTTDFIDLYYPYYLQEFFYTDLNQVFVGSKKLKDNFYTVFFEKIYSQN